MYLPTHWKLVQEYRIYVLKKTSMWAFPTMFFSNFLLFYNNYYNFSDLDIVSFTL